MAGLALFVVAIIGAGFWWKLVSGSGTTTNATTPAGVQDTPASRDTRRMLDLGLLVQAAQEFKAQAGTYPTTHGNVQTLCAYAGLDIGCKLLPYLDGALPTDPVSNGHDKQYFYSSDGTTALFYASLEEDVVSPDQPCITDDSELLTYSNLICVTAP